MVRTLPILFALVVSMMAQEPERVTVPFSDPTGAKRLAVSLLHGSIAVKGHSGREVIIEAKGSGASQGRLPPEGMRRIGGGGAGLTVEESGNLVKVNTSHGRRADLTVLVPIETSVKLNTVTGGNISVDGVNGEIDVNNLNGNISISNVSGAVVAHSLNGRVTVSLNKVSPEKAMSFSTLNGNVDVTLPADIKANVKMKSENGDIFSDFEIALNPSSARPTQEPGGDRKRYRIRFDKAVYGSINGGGPEIQFTTLNGTIYIRKQK
ncbi:MAG TPA: DUF4097 family beta strand repeat-containing protein [Bryobacteraceae bacterium]|nr:DUF4097 family beta strand repeat-containing protein [Bryobacteraceae bacterium]